MSTLVARDDNLVLSLVGVDDTYDWTEQELQQFTADVSDVARSVIARLGSG